MNTLPIGSIACHVSFRSLPRLHAVVICLMWAGSFTANAAPREASRVAVVVRTVSAETSDASVVAGRLISFSLKEGLLLESTDKPQAPPLRTAASDVVHIVTHGISVPPSAGMASVILANGDRIIGTPGEFSDMVVAMESPSVGAIGLPLDDVARWLNPRVPGSLSTWSHPMLGDVSAASDRLLLANGDIIEGIVRSIDRDAFTLETDFGLSRIAQERVAAVVIVSAAPPRDSRLRARVTFVDGTRLTTDEFVWSDGHARMTLLGQADRDIPVRHISRIDIVGGRWRWLSELEAQTSTSASSGAIPWSHRFDSNVLGGPLRVAGQRFEQGIGVHSPSVMIFRLDRHYAAFVTSFGIDDHSGPFADVTVRIKLDGQLKYEQRSVRRRRLFGPLRIDVTNGDRLELIVDFGKMGAIQDRFDWIEPALIR